MLDIMGRHKKYKEELNKALDDHIKESPDCDVDKPLKMVDDPPRHVCITCGKLLEPDRSNNDQSKI